MSDSAELTGYRIKGFQIRFGGPPGSPAGHFVEVETLAGEPLRLGTWKQDGDFWLLQVTLGEMAQKAPVVEGADPPPAERLATSP